MKADPNFLNDNLNDICASYQSHVVGYLLSKMEEAAKKYDVNDVALAGGVSANSELRKRFNDLAEVHGIRSHIPKFEYCTDNAAMIGIVGYFKFLNSDFSDLSKTAKARLHF